MTPKTTEKETLFVGLDVHKETIAVAVAEPGAGAEIRSYGNISGDLHAVEKLLNRLRKTHPGIMLHVAYEAGPCGFVIARRLAQLKVPCTVVAPSMVPRQPGMRIKTDRRDALSLARLLRAGELTPIYVPDADDEAIRDLCRARTDAVDDLRRARQRLKSFLLRHGYHYKALGNWNEAHMRYLRELVMPKPALKSVLEEYIQGVQSASERVARCESLMESQLADWRLRSAVEALMAFKGFQTVAAMVTVSELGDLRRFEHPRQLMAYLGLVPGEHTSGSHRRQGSITKCGNPHARWLLIECGQHYDHAPKVSKELSRRQQGIEERVRKISWSAQVRLYKRFVALVSRKMHRNKAVVAVARELCAFLWEALAPLPCYETPSGTAADPVNA